MYFFVIVIFSIMRYSDKSVKVVYMQLFTYVGVGAHTCTGESEDHPGCHSSVTFLLPAPSHTISLTGPGLDHVRKPGFD